MSIFTAKAAKDLTLSDSEKDVIFDLDEYLRAKDWPVALRLLLIENFQKTSKRYFICDNSRSMLEADGTLVVTRKNGKTITVQCSRWTELSETIRSAADLAATWRVETEFRALNGIAPITVNFDTTAAVLTPLLESEPHGQTPLCQHIREVVADIRAHESELRSTGKVACVIIASDGESTDGDVAEALKELQQLPVWVGIRLCTSEQSVMDYWNRIDEKLELELDVFDDFVHEAEEVKKFNPWLTYGLPLHRLREFGISNRSIDILDEKKLMADQIVGVIDCIVDGASEITPKADADVEGYLAQLAVLVERQKPVWCPIEKANGPWIKMTVLSEILRNELA